MFYLLEHPQGNSKAMSPGLNCGFGQSGFWPQADNATDVVVKAGICYSLLFFLLIACLPAWALEKSADIDTNRPSFTASAIVVPQSSIQVENGTLYQGYRHRKNYFDIPATEVRIGLLKRTEFQMFIPNFVLIDQRKLHLTNGGSSDLQEVGIKQQIGPIKKLQLSVIAAINVPPGSKAISGTGPQPVFRAPWALALTKKWSIGGMQSLVILNSGHQAQYQPFFLLNRALGSNASAFAEYAGFFTRKTQPLNLAHFGMVYKVARCHQVDIHFGFGMNQSAPIGLIGAGYSYRFDWLTWGRRGNAPANLFGP